MNFHEIVTTDRPCDMQQRSSQTAIVLRYSAHIKPHKTIKTIETHKHNMTLIVLSQSIAVSK